MHKKTIFIILITLSFSIIGVYAHLSGAFSDFLAGFEDEKTTEKLKISMESTKKQIEELTPQVEKMEKTYKENEKTAVTKLQFYTSMGSDTYASFLLKSKDAVDVLSNQRLFEKKLENDLESLNQLYLSYMQIKSAKESLEGHAEVLEMIEGNLKAREEFIENYSYPGATKESLTELLTGRMALVWENDAAKIDELLTKDAVYLDKHMNELIKQKGNSFQLNEKEFNKNRELKYYFRKDHIYIHHKKGEADVILIAVMEPVNETVMKLNIEAGFINGIILPNRLVDGLNVFGLDLTKIKYKTKGYIPSQNNGYISFTPEELSGE